MLRSSSSVLLPDTDELGPDFGDYFDFDLGDYLVHEGFCTNEYNRTEEFQNVVQDFCIRTL